MSMTREMYDMMSKWVNIFPQARTKMRIIRMALCLLLNPSRNTITQSLVFGGLDNRDWSADYKAFSRSVWNDTKLFKPIIEETVSYFTKDYIAIAVDDTKVRKTGKKIPMAQYYLDPLSPPFNINLIWGHRFLQFCALLPLYGFEIPDYDDEDKLYNISRGIPVSATNVPALKKPGKRATEEEIKTYKEQKRKNNLSLAFIEQAILLRIAYDKAGAQDKKLLIVADGSFCNSTVFKSDLDRTTIVARCRKDAKLCFRDETSSRRFFSQDVFSPESIRQDKNIPYISTTLFIGKKLRKLRYKEVKNVLWQRGAGKQEMRLIVIAPQPYKSYGNKRLYSKEAYLLSNEHDISTEELVQQYINRWEIEVNHREEKNNLGLGQAQVWNEESVVKVPALLIAAYSMMLLASIKCFGIHRSNDYLRLPKWRKSSVRPSCNDLQNLMRKEIVEDTNLQTKLRLKVKKRPAAHVNQ